MESKEINMVDLLKDKPREYPLYSPMYGKLWLAKIEGNDDCRIITCYRHPLLDGDTRAILEQEDTVSFYPNGTTGDENFNVTKERMLFTMEEWMEYKRILWSDVCARLPYGIFVKDSLDDKAIYTIGYHPNLDNCKPYLRPMSSMTEEEKNEIESVSDALFGDALDEQINECLIQDKSFSKSRVMTYIACSRVTDWLNERHFDYRGLIEKGLALEAPKGMYK